jgi:ATP-binding cassette, subfamily F, member 3
VKSSPGLRIAHLKQEFVESLVLSRTLMEELMASFVEEQSLMAQIAACEDSLSRSFDDSADMDRVLAQLQALQTAAADRQCYALEARVHKVMHSMGFTGEDKDALVGSFSGGWKMRIGLAKMLLCDPYVSLSYFILCL